MTRMKKEIVKHLSIYIEDLEIDIEKIRVKTSITVQKYIKQNRDLKIELNNLKNDLINEKKKTMYIPTLNKELNILKDFYLNNKKRR